MAFSLDGSVYTPLRSIGIAASPNHINLETDQNFAIAPTLARFIRLTATSQAGGDPEAGLGEVRFSGTAIPEPSTYALILSGLAGLAVIRRNRKARK